MKFTLRNMDKERNWSKRCEVKARHILRDRQRLIESHPLEYAELNSTEGQHCSSK
jgi:hypothetical protein